MANNPTGGAVSWRSPSNIALVKYWGKRRGQIPENPSVSITLGKSFTTTTVRFVPAKGEGGLKQFLFEGKEEISFAGRISSYLREIGPLYPFLTDLKLEIESANSFPHSSGIASSASAMSALALCLTSLERLLLSSPSDDDSFFRKASYTARVGSGSAARSVYPGFVLWGKTPGVSYSENEFAVPLNDSIHSEFKDIRDAILIVDEEPKSVSSTAGHSLMKDNPWAPVRYKQASTNAIRLLEVLSAGDIDEFTRIVEKEAMTLHSLMMSSDPGYILMKPGTLAIIEKVHSFRRETKIPVAFTLDAGPNIHLIYPGSFYEQIRKFIGEELVKHCSRGKWIDDFKGEGPVEM